MQLRYIIVLMLGLVPAFAQVHSTYEFSDFTSRPLNVRRVTVTPLAHGADYDGAQLSPKPLIYSYADYNTLTNGSITISNLVAGYAYRVAFSDGFSEPAITNYFGTNASGLVDGNDYKTTYIQWANGVAVQIWYAYLSSTNSSGTSGALTNNETRDVTLTSGVLVLDASSNSNSISTSAGDKIVVSAGTTKLTVDDLTSRIDFTGQLLGNGDLLTNINGSSIASGTVADARIASTITRDTELVAADTVVSNGLVTGLAAGSYAINEQALTGFLRFSSTNTAFLDGGATNAITVVSNATGYASFSFSGTDANTRGISGGTYYPNPPGATLTYTNGATKGAWFSGSTSGMLYVTNSTYPDASQDGADTAAVTFPEAGYPIDDGTWLDNLNAFNGLTITTTYAFGYSPSHAKFHGDGSELVNLPATPGVITNNWQSAAGQVFLTNKVTVMGTDIGRGDIRYNFAAPYSNFFILSSNRMQVNGGIHSGGYYEFMWGETGSGYIAYNNNASFLLRARVTIGIECPTDFATIRLTDDHRVDGIVKLGGQLYGSDSGRYETNNYSGMLGFQPFGGTAGTPLTGMAGIRAKNPAGATVYNSNGIDYSESELWFYTLVPEQFSNTNGGFRNVGDTNWFMIGKSNSVVVKGLTISSNALARWPTAPATHGDAAMVNSNGVVFMLTSGVGLTWTATNKIAP